jgi:two-component sensor histidine kinase
MSLTDDTDLVRVRRHARLIAAALYFGGPDQTKLATAVSEVARNCLQYAEGGWVSFTLTEEAPLRCLEIVAEDEGPGIGNVGEIIEGRYRSRTGLGIGLAGAKRLVDTLKIETSASGTRVTLLHELPAGARAPLHDLAEGAAEAVGQARHQDPVEELIRQNRELMASLADKEFLIREIHHRVKNNFQLISSLIRLQGRSAQGEEATELLQSLAGRIQALALAHERFYRDEDVARVDLRAFLTDLSNEVGRALVPSGQDIEIVPEIAEISVSQDEAISIGLIVNELLTNACKHAFPAGRDGRIEVRGRLENGDLVIAVEDDGVGAGGWPPGAKAGSLGTKVVESTARRLAARLESDASEGLSIKVTIPLQAAPRRNPA